MQLQACQPAGEDHGAEHLECQHRAHARHHGIRSSPFGFMKGSAALCIYLISFYNKLHCLVDEGKAVEAI